MRKDSFPEFLSGFISFLSKNGFITNQNFIPDYIKLIEKLNIDITNKNDIEESLRTFIVKNEIENRKFHYFFDEYFKSEGDVVIVGDNENELLTYKKMKIEDENSLRSVNNKLEELNKKVNSYNDFLKEFNERKEYLDQIKDKLKDCDELYSFLSNEINIKEDEKIKINTDKLIEIEKKYILETFDKLNDISFLNEIKLSFQKIQENLNFFIKHSGKLNKILKRNNELNKLNNRKKELEKDINKLIDKIEQKNRLTLKKESYYHRQNFIGGGSVQFSGNGETELEKDFSKLNKGEKENVYSFIVENAKLFKTKVGNNIRTKNRHKLDMSETIKKACQTNGIPMRLIYEKPKINKSKLILFLDVSGSCRKASELMIFFAYQLKDLFGGGCKVYCFTNQLYDVSRIMEEKNQDIEYILKQVLEIIPTKGVYSNYFVPFEDFRKNHMSDLTKDTISIFIGDARNNDNDSGEDNIKAIARRCKSAFWLNTEENSLWDENDSIISTYAEYMKNVFEVTNTLDLINSLLNIK